MHIVQLLKENNYLINISSSKQHKYVIVVTWAQGIYLICMPKAQGHIIISSKSQVQ